MDYTVRPYIQSVSDAVCGGGTPEEAQRRYERYAQSAEGQAANRVSEALQDLVDVAASEEGYVGTNTPRALENAKDADQRAFRKWLRGNNKSNCNDPSDGNKAVVTEPQPAPAKASDNESNRILIGGVLLLGVLVLLATKNTRPTATAARLFGVANFI